MNKLRERNAAGWNGVPDGRCDEAEMLLRLGQTEEAETLFEQVWADSDARWWVANNAALAYEDADDFAPAAEWLARGCDVAIEHGDPDDLIPQMVDMRRVALTLMKAPIEIAVDGTVLRPKGRETISFIRGQRGWMPGSAPTTFSATATITIRRLRPPRVLPRDRGRPARRLCSHGARRPDSCNGRCSDRLL